MASPNPWHTSHSSSTNTIDDSSSPYYLHHSDNPGILLVNQQLIGDNYASWSRAMQIALSVKNKLGFINGSVTRPPSTDPLANVWDRNNNMVISWLGNSVSKDIAASIIFYDSASDIWNDLKEMFLQVDAPGIYQIRRYLISTTQGQLYVSSYFTKLKTLWEELQKYCPNCSCSACICGGMNKLIDYTAMEYTLLFLMGLNDSCAQILLMDPISNINKVFALVTQEERQRSLNFSSTSQIEPLAMQVRSTPVNQKRFGSDKPNNSSNLNNRTLRRSYCTHCGLQGHTVDHYYRLHGFPPGMKAAQRFSNQHDAHVNVAAQTTFVASSPVSQQFSADQYQKLLQLISPQLEYLSTSNSVHNHSSGISSQEDDWQC